MSKQKPHKGLKKRVKVTARGKVKRQMSFGRHLKSGKSGDRVRRLRRTKLLVGKFAQEARKALCV